MKTVCLQDPIEKIVDETLKSRYQKRILLALRNSTDKTKSEAEAETEAVKIL